MAANESLKIESAFTPGIRLGYSLNEQKLLIREAISEYRKTTENGAATMKSQPECYMTKWDDILLYVEQLPLEPKPIFPEMSKMLWEMLDDLEIASILVRSGADLSKKRSGDQTSSSFLHVLSASDDPQKHELAVRMIEHGANVNDWNAFHDTPFQIAVKNESLSIIEAILKAYMIRSPHVQGNGCSPLKNYKNCFALALRSPKFAKMLELFYQYPLNISIERCCRTYMPWDMSDDHLAMVLLTIWHQCTLEHEKKLSSSVLGTQRNNDDGLHYIRRWMISKNQRTKKILSTWKTDADKKMSFIKLLITYEYVWVEKISFLTFLIRQGMDINGYIKNDKFYPIHVACTYEKYEILQLLLWLGADVNVTDSYGDTPFLKAYVLEDDKKIVNLLIKHFAYLYSKNEKINEHDLELVKNNTDLQILYQSNIDELENMKMIKIAYSSLYDYFYNKTSYELSVIMRNRNIFYLLKKKLAEISSKTFPTFKTDLVRRFGLAKKMRNVISSKEQELEKVFNGILPSVVLRKIARYTFDPVQFEKEYHLSFFE